MEGRGWRGARLVGVGGYADVARSKEYLHARARRIMGAGQSFLEAGRMRPTFTVCANIESGAHARTLHWNKIL